MPNGSASERYYEGKLKKQRNRKITRAVGTTACCGVPCLLVALALVVGIVALGMHLL